MHEIALSVYSSGSTFIDLNFQGLESYCDLPCVMPLSEVSRHRSRGWIPTSKHHHQARTELIRYFCVFPSDVIPLYPDPICRDCPRVSARRIFQKDKANSADHSTLFFIKYK